MCCKPPLAGRTLDARLVVLRARLNCVSRNINYERTVTARKKIYKKSHLVYSQTDTQTKQKLIRLVPKRNEQRNILMSEQH